MEGLPNGGKKRCINYKGEHRTVAMRYPRRKEIINNKKENEEKKQNTYITVTKTNLPGFNTNCRINGSDGWMHAKIFTYTYDALFSVANTGSYEDKLNNMLKMDNFSQVQAPKNHPSMTADNKEDKTIKEEFVAGEEEPETTLERTREKCRE